MASAYRPSSLISHDGTIVSLRYVESISQVSTEEDAVIDKLKDDLTFTVTTVSGCKHTISIKHLVQTYKRDYSFDADMYNTYLSILDRWIHLLYA